VKQYGADTARLFSVFAAPPEKDLDWSERGVEGSFRFLSRVWRLALAMTVYAAEIGGVAAAMPASGSRLDWQDPGAQGLDPDSIALRQVVHDTIRRVTRDIGERMHFNTAVAAIMELVNAIYERRARDGGNADPVVPFAVATVLRLLAPFAPHVAAELWEKLVQSPALDAVPWPEHDPAALVRDSIEVAVQVNGKVRTRIVIPAAAAQEDAIAAALADARIATELAGRTPRKTVYVPGRLVSVVV